MADFDRESMLDMFTYEMNQLLIQLEQNIIQGDSGFSDDAINEIFRIMHTIKGSAAMMDFDSMSTTAHSIEDLFYYLREEHPKVVDFSTLADYVLEGMDFIKNELAKIETGSKPDGDGSGIIKKMKVFLSEIKGKANPGAAKDTNTGTKEDNSVISSATSNNTGSRNVKSDGLNYYRAAIKFEDGCEMENIRAYTLVHNMGDTICNFSHVPEDIIDEDAIDFIRKNGFSLTFSSKLPYNEIFEMLERTVYLKELTLDQLDEEKSSVSQTEGNASDSANVEITSGVTGGFASNEGITVADFVDKGDQKKVMDTLIKDNIDDEKTIPQTPGLQQSQTKKITTTQQHVISVSVSKLDQLLNLMGELVIAEAMVTQNPDLEGLELESFHKETRQLRKIINDVQDTVMSMRMLPLSNTFFKMHRIVRDMCKQLNKEVDLDIIGEETEVDKNIIEHMSDPLMHIIRNSIDHGIESPDVRVKKGKREIGKVSLEAKNSGGDVLIIIKDDGAGLDRDRILAKAKSNGLLRKPENEYTDKEIHQFIFLPGFSTNTEVTSFSGRGVGMDVVSTNIEIVGGSVLVDSTPGEGSTFTLKIPLTLAIIEGMTIKMGDAKYTIPIIAIKQSFKASMANVFIDPSGNEMIADRGEVFNIIRLYEFFNVKPNVTNLEDGIMIMLENGDQTVCVFADELIGEQQVVVKSMPKYIKKIRGISGCTLLGNGDISLIIDVAGFFDK